MSLKVLEFIKNNENWREILSNPPYCLIIKDDNLYNINYTLLQYDLRKSDVSLNIVQESRGLIFETDTLRPVCFPFYKFFNYAEENAHKIDWNTARVYEKLDGSLISVWNNNSKKENEWIISTSGTINADNAICGNSELYKDSGIILYSFEQLFLSTLYYECQFSYDEFFDFLNKDYCYMFELMSPETRIVVPHEKPKLRHIATRNMKTLQELEIDIGIEKPREYNFYSLEDVIETAKILSYNDEGFVICDKNYNRIKIKSPEYVQIHHMRDFFTDKGIIEIIKNNEIDEVLTYFPEFKNKVKDIQNKINKIASELDKDISLEIKKYIRKDLAEYAKSKKYPHLIFQYYDNKVHNAEEWIWSNKTKRILNILKDAKNDTI